MNIFKKVITTLLLFAIIILLDSCVSNSKYEAVVFSRDSLNLEVDSMKLEINKLQIVTNKIEQELKESNSNNDDLLDTIRKKQAELIFAKDNYNKLKNESSNETLKLMTQNENLQSEKIKLESEKIKLENELKQTIEENEKIISNLNAKINKYLDSVNTLGNATYTSIESSDADANDFLNKYFFDQIPLNNHSFSLKLSKIIYGNATTMKKGISRISTAGWEYNQDIPELLNADDFFYYIVKKNIQIDGKFYLKTILSNLSKQNRSLIDDKLPKIEILKNKLFSFKYSNGDEESLLYNVKKLDLSFNNNQRRVLQIQLASEELNKTEDILWRIYTVGSECYIALNSTHLQRLKVKLNGMNDGVEIGNNEETRLIRDLEFNYKKDLLTTGNNIYLERKKDIYMNSSEYIDPNDLIFLFKLVPISN